MRGKRVMASSNHPYQIKPDKRFKPGHIQVKSGVWRGHPDSVNFKTVTLPPLTEETRKVTLIPVEDFMKAPPIEITPEMAKAIRENT